MIGFFKNAVSVVKHAGKVAPVIKAAVDSKDDIQLLFVDARQKWDTDGDGKPDLTTQEAIEFLGKLFAVIAKRL